MIANTQAVETISPVYVNTGKEPVSYHIVSYTDKDILNLKDSFLNVNYGKLVAIKIKEKGSLIIKIKGKNKSSVFNYNPYVDLYTSDNLKDTKSYREKTMIDDSKDYLNFKINKAGTYYLLFASSQMNTSSVEYKYQALFYSSKDKTLKNKEYQYIADVDSREGGFYKINLPSNGHIKIQSTEDITFFLYNSNKKKINAESVWVNKSHSPVMYLKKGTYYIKTIGPYDITKIRYVFTSSTSNSDFTIKNGQTVSYYVSKNIYVKYKATKTGYIKIKGKYIYDDIALCNSSKKKIATNYLSDEKNELYFGVKKGTTYYLKLEEGEIKFKLTETAISNKSNKPGKSKSKATNLKANTLVKGVIPAGSSQTDWYKIILKKDRSKITFRYGGKTSGAINFKFYVYYGNKKGTKLTEINTAVRDSGTCFTDYNIKDGFTATNALNYGKPYMAKGTYYIRVAREDKTSSGYYYLKWY
jgi:hypothetical protein